MSTPKAFGIYTARFPFLDSGETKIRPVVVVSKPQGSHKIIAIVPVSSRLTREEVDVAITEWSKAGLLKPSVARVHRLTTMLQADLIADLGVLSVEEIRALQTSLRKYLDL
ncbi:MAG TPA: type II toxin-antitoxin system PemK/MazF family toxin [Patescibacteria group bacterium]|nr:type II toxin-antitoxin system PemK/MazF family toxin [Patescibacteria group bacterium]